MPGMQALMIALAFSIANRGDIAVGVNAAGPWPLHRGEGITKKYSGGLWISKRGVVVFFPKRTLMMSRKTYIETWSWPMTFELGTPIDTVDQEREAVCQQLYSLSPEVHVMIHALPAVNPYWFLQPEFRQYRHAWTTPHETKQQK
jgi:hypothetical protein